MTKLELYKQCGVKEYWVVDPINEHVLIYTLECNDIINSKTYSKDAHKMVCSDVFEGLEVDPSDVFV